MSSGLVVLVLLGSVMYGSGIAPGLAALFFGLEVYCRGLGPGWSFSNDVLLLLYVASIPTAAYLAGAFLDRLALDEVRGSIFRRILPPLAAWQLLEEGAWSKVSLAKLPFGVGSGPSERIFFVVALGAKVFFVGSVAAIFVGTAALVAELPARWLSGSLGGRTEISWSALRAMVYCALLATGFSLLVSLVESEFQGNFFHSTRGAGSAPTAAMP